jgi:hypothetical protein
MSTPAIRREEHLWHFSVLYSAQLSNLIKEPERLLISMKSLSLLLNDNRIILIYDLISL